MRLRQYLHVAASAAVLSALAACGGGQRADADVATGRLFPAAAGVTMVEYAGDGRVLQTAPPTDSEGRYRFAAALSGSRIVALADHDDRRLPDEWTALVTDARVLDATPLTTLQEQFVRFGAGRTPAAARAELVRGIGAACGSDAGVQVDTALSGRTDAAPAAWLLRALAAYVRALKDVGVVPDESWPGRIDSLAPLLGRLCTLSRQVDGSEWAAELNRRVPELAAAEARARQPYLAQVRQRTADEVLRLIARSAAVLVYPELQRLLDPTLALWQGREAEISLTLAEQLARAVSGLPAGATPADAQVALRSLVLTASGRVAQAVDGKVDLKTQFQPIWRVDNESSTDRTTLLSIDGRPLFDRMAMLTEMLRLPGAGPAEPLYRRAWRLVKHWSGGAVPITGGRFQHQTDLYLRSIGAGRCDDDASALRELWSWLGYEARVWGLGGHIVAEVRVNGRWEMYDSHYGVYFHTRSGTVAGVEELHADPERVLAPVEVIDETFFRDMVEISQIYESDDGNVVIPWYGEDPADPMGNRLVIPARGRVEVVGGGSYAFPSLRWSDPTASVRTSQVRLWIPPGYTGTLNLPLILADATGGATLTVLGEDLAVGPEGIRERLQDFYETDPDVGIRQVGIRDVGPEGMTLTLLLSASYFPRQEVYQIALTSFDARGLKLVSPTAEPAR